MSRVIALREFKDQTTQRFASTVDSDLFPMRAALDARPVITRQSDRYMRPVADQLAELYRHNHSDIASYYARAIQHLFWDSFCLQWVAIAWCVVIGRDA